MNEDKQSPISSRPVACHDDPINLAEIVAEIGRVITGETPPEPVVDYFLWEYTGFPTFFHDWPEEEVARRAAWYFSIGHEAAERARYAEFYCNDPNPVAGSDEA